MNMKEESSVPLLEVTSDDDLEDDQKQADNSSRASSSENSSRPSSIYLQTYKRRWLMLTIFCLNTLVNGCMFTSLAPITNIVSKYYHQPPVMIEWLSNSFLLIFGILAIPTSFAVTRLGIRPLLVAASLFDAIASILHYFGDEPDRFWLVIIGQGFASVAYAMIIHLPGQISAKWFPEAERGTSTSIGVFMNIAGVAIGYLQTTQMVEKHSSLEETRKGIQNIFITQMIVVIVVFLITALGYREKPPSPPTNIVTFEEDEDVKYNETIISLLKDKNFFLISQSYGIYFGLFVTFLVLTNDLVTTVYRTGYETKIGWMGFTGLVTSIVSMFLLGLWLDRSKGHRMIAVTLNATSAIVWLIFILILTGTTNFIALFISYGVLGAVGIPFFSTGIEQAAEMSYPTPEIISSTVILMFGNIYGFLLILILGILSENGHIYIVSYTMFCLYLISTLLAYFAKTELKRSVAEDEATRSLELSETKSNTSKE